MEELKGERNRVVVRFKAGRLLKGYTHDFKPMVDAFHLVDQAGSTHTVRCQDLKAVFFVKTFEGDSKYEEKKNFSEVDCAALKGLKVKLTFLDGEMIRGFSLGYGRDRKGFYLIPIDPKSNNDRIYVVTSALRDVKLGSDAEK
jgi:hypothetical protein